MLLVLSLTAQASFLNGLTRHDALPHAIDGAHVSRTVADDWTGDLRPDCALLANGLVCLQHGPDTFPTGEMVSAGVAGSGVLDLETLPRSLGRPALLALGPSGLRVLDWNAQNQAFDLSATYTAGGFGSALSVRRADLDGNASPDYIGLAASGSRIVLLRDFDGTSAITLTPIAVGSPILALEPIDWTGSAPDEIAVRLANGVRVYASSGALLFSLSTSGTTRVIEPVRCSGETDERLAYVETATGTGDDWLGLVGNGTPFSSLHLGAFGIAGAAAGDVDGDQDEDLVFSHQASSDLLVLENGSNSGATPFTLGGVHVFLDGPSGSVPGNQAEPCLVDLDRDGDLDLVAATFPDNQLCVQRNDQIHGTDQWPMWSGGRLDTLIWPGALPSDPLQLRFHVLEPSAALGFTPDGIEIVFWRQPIQGQPADPAPTHTLVASVAPGFGEWTSSLFLLNEPWNFDAVYYPLLRMVQRDATGKIVNAGPTGTFFYTMRADTYDVVYDSQPPAVKQLMAKQTPGSEQGAYAGGGGPSAGPPPPAH